MGGGTWTQSDRICLFQPCLNEGYEVQEPEYSHGETLNYWTFTACEDKGSGYEGG
jgi:hypothetical protein